MTTKDVLPFFALLTVLGGCHKKSDPSAISDMQVELVAFSAKQGHIFNVFALDRIHTHSYIAVEGMAGDPWIFQINDVDLLGETGTLIADPMVRSSLVIEQGTTSRFNFVNTTTGENKKAQLVFGARFSIDFATAAEAQDLIGLSRDEQRDTLRALATQAGIDRFTVTSH